MKFVNILVLIRYQLVIVRKNLLRDILETVTHYVTRYPLGCDVLNYAFYVIVYIIVCLFCVYFYLIYVFFFATM